LSFSLVPSMTRNSERLGTSLFGEEIRSVRALVQKMSNIARMFNSTSLDMHIAVPHFFPPPFTYTHSPVQVLPGVTLTPFWTWYGHFAAMFGCVRGSMRYKTLCQGATATMFATPIRAADYAAFNSALTTNTSNGPSFAGDQFSGIQQQGQGGGEFTLPGYQKSTFAATCDYSYVTGLSGSNQRIDVINVLPVGTGANAIVYHFVGAGPDISLFRFRRVPPMVAAS